MEELTCPDCQTKFPNKFPYRRTGKYQGDIVTCPNCYATGTPRRFMPQTTSPGIGVRLQAGPNSASPAQLALQKMNQMAQKLDKKGLYKISDKIEKIISNY